MQLFSSSLHPQQPFTSLSSVNVRFSTLDPSLQGLQLYHAKMNLKFSEAALLISDLSTECPSALPPDQQLTQKDVHLVPGRSPESLTKSELPIQAALIYTLNVSHLKFQHSHIPHNSSFLICSHNQQALYHSKIGRQRIISSYRTDGGSVEVLY